MESAMKVCLAGEGAMGGNHVKTLQSIEGVEVVTLAGGIEADAAAFAKEHGIPHHSLDLEECLSQPGVEAAVLPTPNQVHASQSELALNMGKHVFVELPMALNLKDSEHLVSVAEKSGLVCMVNHSMLYNPFHREIYRQVHSGEFTLYHIVQQTYFMRRENLNMHGKPRTWTDELLWHQACHMVAFVAWLLEGQKIEAWGQAGPKHSKLDIPMDITIGLRSSNGIIVSSANSFNNHGPITGMYRYIGEERTYLVEKGTMTDTEGKPVPLAEESFPSPIHEFISSIREGREPLTSVQSQLPVMRILHEIQEHLDA